MKETDFRVKASNWYTMAAVITALGLFLGGLGLYLHSRGSEWGIILSAAMVLSILLYGVCRWIAGNYELKAIDGVSAADPRRLASLWYTRAAVITALGLFLGGVGLYLHARGSEWGVILSAAMVFSILIYGLLRYVAGHYEKQALAAGVHDS